jgi:5-methyltetrahydropteroyltriglutamate--homocysteine methyltransferase
MRTSADRILTTHVGSLPRPDDLIEANRLREAGETSDEAGFQAKLRAAVGDVVQRQRILGADVPGNGEFGKSMGHSVNFGAWMSYAYLRLGGLDLAGPDIFDVIHIRYNPGRLLLPSFANSRERARFAATYADPESGVSAGPRPATGPVGVGPLRYVGGDVIRTDTANFKAALGAAGIARGS